MENLSYLFAAFTIVWAVVFGYVFNMSRKQRQLSREIDSLREELKVKADESA